MTFLKVDPLNGLKDFQRAAAKHAFDRLYLKKNATRHFLVADETGLGKTLVARGICALAIDHLRAEALVKRIDIIYVCSNADIADQNLKKLLPKSNKKFHRATRLTMLITQSDLLNPDAEDGEIPVTLVSLTPGTSFSMGQSTGMAPERVVLYLLLQEILSLSKSEATHLRYILRGGVQTGKRFKEIIENSRNEWSNSDGQTIWEPSIFEEFGKVLKGTEIEKSVRALIKDVNSESLSVDQKKLAKKLIIQLRTHLARSSVKALEPDLIILDEFQRFRDLLKTGDEEAEDQNTSSDLAQRLFEQPDARILLLSATPYKPFTFAGEHDSGENHYSDFFETLNFLLKDDTQIEVIKDLFRKFRGGLLVGDDVSELRDQLQTSLLRVMCRTERPAYLKNSGAHIQNAMVVLNPPAVADLLDFVALEKLSALVDAPILIEYWKSSPYFSNFMDGYKIGESVKRVAADRPSRARDETLAALKSTRRISPRQISKRLPIDLSHARLERLVSDTLKKSWWKLLWLPPSRPYWSHGGPYLETADQSITKKLIFSSWVAAPTAIASLLSYEADRKARVKIDGGLERRDFTPRLQYRLDQGVPASQTTLMIFWPNSGLADLIRVSDFFKNKTGVVTQEEIISVAAKRITPLVSNFLGSSKGSESSDWYWKTAASVDTGELGLGNRDLIESLSVPKNILDSDAIEVSEPTSSLSAHVEEMLRNKVSPRLLGRTPEDLVEVLSLLAIAGPGNVALRSLKGICSNENEVTTDGLWKAAAALAAGFRTLFNREESTNVIDAVTQSDDTSPYWRRVLEYCFNGNLQSVLDEHLYSLSINFGRSISTDDDLMAIANDARRALVIRGANYLGFSADGKDSIKFQPRFALRYGNIKQKEEDVRLPEVRAAFNSPFWPFVLASTSIGQEGVDFHWWCHSIIHWNLPSNPVDFEQREGRVDRFRGHAIRKNIAQKHGALQFAETTNPWFKMFELAEAEPKGEIGDLYPSWVYPGSAFIERSVYVIPLSKDEQKWRNMQKYVALYRLAFGQPRQEDLIHLLLEKNVDLGLIARSQISLSPPAF